MVTIKDNAGVYDTFKVDAAVKNLESIHKGDQAVATYAESIGLRFSDPVSSSGDIGKKDHVTIDIGLKGDKPYLITARIVEFRAEVDTIKHYQRKVSVKGRKGNNLTFKVGKNIKGLENVKKGDRVVIYFTEPIGILIEKTNEVNKSGDPSRSTSGGISGD